MRHDGRKCEERKRSRRRSDALRKEANEGAMAALALDMTIRSLKAILKRER